MGNCHGNTRGVRNNNASLKQHQALVTARVGDVVFQGDTVKQQPANGTLLSGGGALRGLEDVRCVDLKSRVHKYGLPTAAVYPPGECQFGEAWTSAPLLERFNNHHDTIVLTFGLPDSARPLGLATCACIMLKCNLGGDAGEVVRPYTPISTNAMVGRFQILLKVYEGGAVSQHLKDLSIGARVQFKHSVSNVKIQYPFRRQHVTMLAGGSGITPIVQALHAILGTPGDNTIVSLIYSNKTTEDVICEGLLDTWAELYADRLSVLQWISRGDDYSLMQGHIDRDAIEEHTVGPSEDVLVMVCGPASMYEELCGPRESPELSGLLSEMGYSANQVVKL